MHMVPQHVLDLFHGVKVLVVDDEYYSRKVIRTLLSSIGVANIHDAASGEQGLEVIRSVAPDIVLVDWEMPGMDGAAFARAVRTPGDFPHPNVPMIMLTGHSERWRVMEALRLGVNEYLLKPVSSKMLLDRLMATLDQAAADHQGGPLLRARTAPRLGLSSGERRLARRDRAPQLRLASFAAVPPGTLLRLWRLPPSRRRRGCSTASVKAAQPQCGGVFSWSSLSLWRRRSITIGRTMHRRRCSRGPRRRADAHRLYSQAC